MRKQQVVVAYDFTQESNVAIDRALELAAHDPALVLHFVTVLAAGESYLRAEEIRVGLLARVTRLLGERAPSANIELFAHVHIGRPDEEILEVAREVGADFIVIGTHDRGPVGRLVLGSVSQEIVRHARCNVILARYKGYDDVQLEKIVETPHHKLPALAHRYEYSTALSEVRALPWPL